MDYNQIKSLEDIKNYVDKYTNFPNRIINDELHIWVNNANFKYFKDDHGENFIIQIKNVKADGYYFSLNVVVEKDGIEFINIQKCFDIEWDRNLGKAIWEHIVSELLEKNVVHPDELDIGGSLIFGHYKTSLPACERIVMKMFKEVFCDFSDEQLENIYHDIINKDPGFWIDIIFIGAYDNTNASLMVMANEQNYCESYKVSVFELKEKLIEIRKELENLGCCKKKENN